MSTQRCTKLTERKRNLDRHSNQISAQSTKFYLNENEIETVTSFKYLGRYLKATIRDDLAVHSNITKARLQWNRISPVLRAHSFPNRIKGLFYKAIVQDILLFGADSWTLTPFLLSTLNSFHHHVARSLSTLPITFNNNDPSDFRLPSNDAVLDDVGLYSMKNYINVRKQLAINAVSNSSRLYKKCLSPLGNQGNWWNLL